MVDLLRTPEIRAAFGARDMWQLIEQVSSKELSDAVNAQKYRALGRAATRIFDWLARRAHGIISLDPAAGIAGTSDQDLVHAATQWIGVSTTTSDWAQDQSTAAARAQMR